jgi:hypothetical protein
MVDGDIFFQQITYNTVALSQQMIDERILATWMEKPSIQCVAMCISIDSEVQFQRNNCMHEWQILKVQSQL